ncbi:MAG: winged helix-turn-helix domain-containing protein [Myxococcota bacterium]
MTPEDQRRLTELLAYLCDRPGQVVSAAELLKEVWAYSPNVRSRAVVNTVARLRKKLDPEDHRLGTVYGKGYQLDLPDDGGLIGGREFVANVRSALQTDRLTTDSVTRRAVTQQEREALRQIQDPKTPRQIAILGLHYAAFALELGLDGLAQETLRNLQPALDELGLERQRLTARSLWELEPPDAATPKVKPLDQRP